MVIKGLGRSSALKKYLTLKIYSESKEKEKKFLYKMASPGPIFEIILFNMVSMGDGDSRNWCYMRENKKRDFNVHKTC